jgi:hypothetical protein
LGGSPLQPPVTRPERRTTQDLNSSLRSGYEVSYFAANRVALPLAFEERMKYTAP